MTKEEMIELLKSDLRNEWTHLNFYLFHASAVVGLHRHEFKELLMKEAGSEMTHVIEFSDVIRGLGGEPESESNEFQKFSDPSAIIAAACEMEQHVVSNYTQRIKQAEQLGGVDGQWLEIFLEKQIEHSREDVDEFRQMLRGM
jgi:bacterioferritin (cytochrome b1)